MCLLPSSLFLSTDRVTISAEKSKKISRGFLEHTKVYLDGKGHGWLCLRSGKVEKEGRKERRWNVNADFEPVSVKASS